MSKYDPLREHLERQNSDVVTMTFAELEAVVRLPAAAKRHPFWWSNEDPRTTVHAQSIAWQRAGFDAEPNLRGKRVTFRRKPEP